MAGDVSTAGDDGQRWVIPTGDGSHVVRGRRSTWQLVRLMSGVLLAGVGLLGLAGTFALWVNLQITEGRCSPDPSDCENITLAKILLLVPAMISAVPILVGVPLLAADRRRHATAQRRQPRRARPGVQG
jgi:hypothetical protein